MRTFRQARGNLLLAVAAALLALGVAEGLTRVLAPYVRDHAAPGGLFTADDLLGWTLRANARIVHRTRHFVVAYAIDAEGHRDRPRVPAKAAGIHRVLAYGDSHLFGWGVAASARYADLLEGDEGTLEIWNRGVPGYGLDQQILAYERDAAVAAGEVMLWISKGTLERARHATMYRKSKPHFVVDDRGALILHPPRRWSVSGAVYPSLSALYLPYLVERWLLADGMPGTSRGRGRGVAALGSFERALLGRAATLAAARRHRLTLVSILADDTPADLRDWCTTNHVTLLEPGVPLEDELIFGSTDGHWNELGHRRVAERLRAHFRP
jgi:hypothetical protein